MARVVGFDEAKKLRVTCDNCTAIVEYTKSEVREVNGTDYSGGADGCEYIFCPNCGKRLILRSW
jgi:uncharacterized C2H2 Zn-finger protein